MACSEVFIAICVGLTNKSPESVATITDYSLSIDAPSGTMRGERVIPFIQYQVDRAESSSFASSSIPEMRILLNQPYDEIVELEELVRSSPLQAGLERVGWMQFRLHDVDLDNDYKDNGVFRIGVRDSHGSNWEIARAAGKWGSEREFVKRCHFTRLSSGC